MKNIDHWIGGARVAPGSGAYFDDLNPVDDSVYARAAAGTADDVNRAVEAGVAAFRMHRNLPAAVREGWMFKAAEIMERDGEPGGLIVVEEQPPKGVFAPELYARKVLGFRHADGTRRQLQMLIPAFRHQISILLAWISP